MVKRIEGISIIDIVDNLEPVMRKHGSCYNPEKKQFDFAGFADKIVSDIKHQGYCTDQQGVTPLLRGAVYRDTEGRFYAAYREGGYWNAGEWVDEFSADDFSLAIYPGFADAITAAIEADQHADLHASQDRESATPNTALVG